MSAPDDGVHAPEVGTATLPARVRDRVLALAADALAKLPAGEVPARLQAVARFTPRQRVRRGGSAIAAVLDSDPAFFARVAEAARAAAPELAEELAAGRLPGEVDVVDVAALAFVLRPPGWAELVATAAADSDANEVTALQHEIDRLRDQLAATRAQGRVALESARADTAHATDQVRALRAEVADARRRVAAAESARGDAARAAEGAAADAARRVGAAESEVRRLRERVSGAEAALEEMRSLQRTGRAAEDVRLRLLLDTLVGTVAGLRRELALPPAPEGGRPADLVAATLGLRPPADHVAPPARALTEGDPAVLDEALARAGVHLVVDGYNVTKSGYGTLPLDKQRERLITGLMALAARTGAEVTCVFDGTDLDHPLPSSSRRGVRVLFSPPGTSADEVVRRLARAEPPGRPVVVISTDREVVDGVSGAGALALPAAALLARLGRG